ncbi:sigma-70 family RNA polymerase sigma factor [Lentzea nigeriaca]|uniref:sigma-70 family RNA polymerase sigma factor n=1 Tax=Lentzea nigeriaca TaxID=1128665 RepID=UPI00195D9944|nr:sigma-70 family RNA polymerase sigma factor [Lentzea nigeriaca]MBM7856273.1 RNA polymerase sigma factor (sigma-70 family) [Lentzea nigeriaca]
MSDDAELTQRVRAGDDRAVTELYRRHHPAVLALSRRLCADHQAAEDLANEAFTRTLRTIRAGSGGPSDGWRPYLYAVVRNTAAEWARDHGRVVLTADYQDLESDLSAAAAPELPDELVTRAFQSLPVRSRHVLWHTLVEDEPPERVASMLGITREHVNVLAQRAREGLRTAYLAAHVETGSAECREFADRLAAIVRNPKRRIPRALREHLDDCPNCARAQRELRDLNTTLRAALPLAALPFVVEKAAPASAATGSSGLFAGLPNWAVPAGVASAGIGITAALLFGPDAEEPSLPTTAPTQSQTAPATSTSPSRSSSAVPIAPSTTTTVVTGTRITFAGKCVGESSGEISALPCADPSTAWRRNDAGGGLQLINVVSGRCLTAGEQYDTTAFNGTGMRAVRLAPCDATDAQRWHTPGFSDGVPRLVSVPTGAALSIGERTAGKPAPTAFILYMPYTNAPQQRITLD